MVPIVCVFEKLNQQIIPFLEYVRCIGQILFSVNHEELKKLAKHYSSTTPPPLNTQFPNRLGKRAAIEKHRKRINMNKVQLFPSGYTN